LSNNWVRPTSLPHQTRPFLETRLKIQLILTVHIHVIIIIVAWIICKILNPLLIELNHWQHPQRQTIGVLVVEEASLQ
jgi:hypothetical protein